MNNRPQTRHFIVQGRASQSPMADSIRSFCIMTSPLILLGLIYGAVPVIAAAATLTGVCIVVTSASLVCGQLRP
jgi:hypothetical protein